MSSTWPATLPQYPIEAGYTRQIKSNLIRSAMDYGPDKLRRRTTSSIVQIVARFILTTAQVGILDTFYNDTVLGTGAVSRVDDVTAATEDYYFVGPPAYSLIEPNNWYADITFEVRGFTGALGWFEEGYLSYKLWYPF